MDNGWLVPYSNKEFGPPKGLIPLMAVLQTNKHKVHPVMDYRELNTYVETFTGAADVCAEKLQDWSQQGANMSILDLRKAYLQIRVEKSLWPYQTVVFKGKRYCLTRLGFGLNVAPLIMRAVLNAVLAQNETINRATSAIQTIHGRIGRPIPTALRVQTIWKWYCREVSSDNQTDCCVKELLYYGGCVLV